MNKQLSKHSKLRTPLVKGNVDANLVGSPRVPKGLVEEEKTFASAADLLRPTVLRQEIGDVLRSLRQRQGRTLREISSVAKVSLGYLSEVERGQKEASSELLCAICEALNIALPSLLRLVADRLERRQEATAAAQSYAQVNRELAELTELKMLEEMARMDTYKRPNELTESEKVLAVKSSPSEAMASETLREVNSSWAYRC